MSTPKPGPCGYRVTTENSINKTVLEADAFTGFVVASFLSNRYPYSPGHLTDMSWQETVFYLYTEKFAPTPYFF
mgnify:CR=1 FL=1